MKRCLIFMLPFAAVAVTFDEFYATHPDKDIHRAWAAEAKRNKVRAAREQETAAAVEAVKE